MDKQKVNHLHNHLLRKTQASASMDGIMKVAAEHQLLVLEDCAQSFGAKLGSRLTGTIGLVMGILRSKVSLGSSF